MKVIDKIAKTLFLSAILANTAVSEASTDLAYDLAQSPNLGAFLKTGGQADYYSSTEKALKGIIRGGVRIVPPAILIPSNCSDLRLPGTQSSGGDRTMRRLEGVVRQECYDRVDRPIQNSVPRPRGWGVTF